MPDQLTYRMGKSAKILRVIKEIRKVSLKDGPVLISGEQGSCKELVAKTIHDNSPRRSGPFVSVNLASIPKESVGEKLFGCGKDGSVTAGGAGASSIETASGGTLCLHNICELEADLQEILVRFIRNGAHDSTDQESPRQPGVRMVCTTCGDFKEIAGKGTLRRDLYDALHSFHIRIPALRERKDDVPAIAQYFLNRAAEKYETGPKELSEEARDFLLKYDWPGDECELEEMIKKAALLSSGGTIGKKDLLLGDIHAFSIKEFLEEKLKRYLKGMTQLGNCNLYDTVLSEVERSLITIVLRETDGNQLKAAKTLGINRNTLRAKIKEYKIRL